MAWVRQLEAQTGARLFNRTTRSAALAEAGGKRLQPVRSAHGELRINTRSLPPMP